MIILATCDDFEDASSTACSISQTLKITTELKRQSDSWIVRAELPKPIRIFESRASILERLVEEEFLGCPPKEPEDIVVTYESTDLADAIVKAWTLYDDCSCDVYISAEPFLTRALWQVMVPTQFKRDVYVQYRELPDGGIYEDICEGEP